MELIYALMIQDMESKECFELVEVEQIDSKDLCLGFKFVSSNDICDTITVYPMKETLKERILEEGYEIRGEGQ